MVFVIRCLYSAVSLTLVREQRFYKNYLVAAAAAAAATAAVVVVVVSV